MNEAIRLPGHVLADVAMIKEYIDKNPLQTRSTEYLADLAGLHRKLLQKAFKFYYHVTISEYQLHKRMEAATLLLQEGRLSHKQIACRCGYHAANNFSRAFKKVYKCSPKSYVYTINEHPMYQQDTKKA